MSESFLSQNEIDELLKKDNGKSGSGGDSFSDAGFGPVEKDVIGEIGNISVGASSTALSDFLGKKVEINLPEVSLITWDDLEKSFEEPYVLVEVRYRSGIEGTNLMFLKTRDAAVIADLMMGGDGTRPEVELDELRMSAVNEAMNQMIGSAVTSLSKIFKKKIDISPPEVLKYGEGVYSTGRFRKEYPLIVAISFNLTIANVLKSRLIQIMPIETAKDEVKIFQPIFAAEEQVREEASGDASAGLERKEEIVRQEKMPAGEQYASSGIRNLDLILDVPVNVSVRLGRTVMSIGEILKMRTGSLVELEKHLEEPVEVLVNGTLVATGEVVVVNENFGVKIVDIISPASRIKKLGES